MSSLLTDGDLALGPGGARSPWLREALALETDSLPARALDGFGEADVAIVGGGYSGLWTALQLSERAPDLRVVVLEQDICGGGPSGRNGGFVNGWWDELGTLVDLYGDEGALSAAREVAASVRAIGAWCDANGVEAHYRRAGMLTVSTTPLHDGAWRRSVDTARRLGVGNEYVELSASEVAERCRSPRFRGGALMRDAATLQPALLARGLRRVALQRGVTVHEQTRVNRVRHTARGFRLLTENGELRARQVVLALNAWGADWPGLRRSILAWSSYMVRTEPIPDRVAELGWTGGESIVDARLSVHYFQVTADGRIAFGAGGGRPGYGGRIGRSFTHDVRDARRAAFGFRHLFPQLADVRLTDAWGGPIDVSPHHLPRFGSLQPGLHYAAGYSGNGVAPSHLAGRVLAALVLGSNEPLTRLPMVGPPSRRFPPEPLRYVGARIMREAMIRREDLEEQGRRAPWWLRQLTRIPRRLGYHLGLD
ncbi:MAG TPA: FAD-binding oxidoreductase [Candidatus Limnocylindria bacterium]|nr:FAD-binding oxidoreductase [Candidatus Limnocylindria bacterium]